LFLLFFNDIVCCMADNVSVKLFADDVKIYTVIDCVNINSSQLQHILDLVESYKAVHWQLKLSPTKCSVMRLNPKRTTSVAHTYTVGVLFTSYHAVFGLSPMDLSLIIVATIKTHLLTHSIITR